MTFGSEGCSINITAGVKRCRKCKKTFKAHVVQLQIVRDGKNVTGKNTDAYAGETVSLKGKVLPDTIKGSDWEWKVPGNLVKEFKVSPDKHTGQRINYDPNDWMKQGVELHWVDGTPEGEDKEVTLTATVNGKPMPAKTTVKVKRPTALFTVTFSNTQIDRDPDPRRRAAVTQVDFMRDKIAAGRTAQWVQLGVFNTRDLQKLGLDIIEFRPPKDDHLIQHPGLDDCAYPYDKRKNTQDFPRVGFSDLLAKRDFEFHIKMWLMWKPPEEKPGIYIPIASASWYFKGTMIFSATPPSPVWAPAVFPLPNPITVNSAPVNELEYPEWTQCLKVNQ